MQPHESEIPWFIQLFFVRVQNVRENGLFSSTVYLPYDTMKSEPDIDPLMNVNDPRSSLPFPLKELPFTVI